MRNQEGIYEYTLNEYQTDALRTASVRKGVEMETAICALGLTGEAGEFADMVKKWVGHGHEFDAQKGAKELGDVLWYIARLANLLGFTLGVVAQMNTDKLRTRYPGGFSTEASKARVDVVEPGVTRVYGSEGQLIAVGKSPVVETQCPYNPALTLARTSVPPLPKRTMSNGECVDHDGKI